MPVVVAADKLP